MPIHKLLKETAFDPDAVNILVSAYDECLKRLQLADKEDPITGTLARKIIDVARGGERDPSRLCQQALDRLGS
jgi:hypothetical protein